MICCGPHLQLLAATPCFRAMHVSQGTADAGPFAGPCHIGFDALDGVRLRVDTVRPASAEISTCNPAQSLRPPRQASRKPTKPSSRQHPPTGIFRPRATVSGLQPFRCPVPSSQRYEAKGRHWGPRTLATIYLERQSGANRTLECHQRHAINPRDEEEKSLSHLTRKKTPTNPGTLSRHNIQKQPRSFLAPRNPSPKPTCRSS